MRRPAALPVVLCAAVPPALPAAAGGWPTEVRNVRRTGQSEVVGPRSPARHANVTLSNVGRGDGKLYAVDTLRALDRFLPRLLAPPAPPARSASTHPSTPARAKPIALAEPWSARIHGMSRPATGKSARVP